jgi:primosomal protein N' (replication factor Y)
MLNQQFPDYPVIRIDSDSTQQRSALESMLNRVNAGGPCILIGTQLLAKGHHFTGITLALVLDVDQGFFSSDYRAIERTAQLIIQTGGRSGREALPGAVYLSTTLQDLPELQALIQSDYLTFAQNLLQQRKHHKLPPYASHATVKALAREPETAYRFLAGIAQQARASHGCEILGPVRPGMEKRAGWYRAQLLITSKSRQSRAITLANIEKLLRASKNKLPRWSIDIDPLDLM